MEELLKYIERQMVAERNRVHFHASSIEQKRGVATVVTKLQEARFWLNYAQENGYNYKGGNG